MELGKLYANNLYQDMLFLKIVEPFAKNSGTDHRKRIC